MTGRIGAMLVALSALVVSCGGEGVADEAQARPAPIDGVPGEVFFARSCAPCHGVDRAGRSGPALLPDVLSEDDAFYAAVIQEGRPEKGMPAWGGVLDDAEVASLVAMLRSPPGEGSAPDPGWGLDGVSAPAALELGEADLGSSLPFTWVLSNASTEAVDAVRFTSPSLSVFLLDALPIRIEAGGSATLSAVLVPVPGSPPGEVTGSAVVDLVGPGGEGSRSLSVSGVASPPDRALAMTEVPVRGMPVRLASWDRYLFVGYFDGTIDVMEFDGPTTLNLVERIEAIALTPNHGPDGAPQPEVGGRLIGGIAVDDTGTLYVTHADPRLDEGEFSRTGHLADLNSGAVTALDGPPGSYGAPGHRRDLVLGLPRNVTNHIPLGVAWRAGSLFVAVGAMTDSGSPDDSKPDPDTGLSGSILRVDLAAGEGMFPVSLTSPGGDPAAVEALPTGVIEIWATGVRNGFGLAFVGDDLFLTDQGSDGGWAPSPAEGVPGFGPHFGPDHMHLVARGAYLGQPNPARGEMVLDDGSGYATAVVSPGYTAPVHAFGLHDSATGIVAYRGDRFPDLPGTILVAKFSGTVGLQALRLDGTRVVEVRQLVTRPEVNNVTDVVVGPDGQIVFAEMWDMRLRIATGWR